MLRTTILEGTTENMVQLSLSGGDDGVAFSVVVEIASQRLSLQNGTEVFGANDRAARPIPLTALGNQIRDGDEVFYVAATLMVDGNCSSQTMDLTTALTVVDDDRYVFVAEATAQGNAAAASTGGAALFWDTFCSDNDGTRPTVAWRALIHTSQRRPPSGGGQDWPIRAGHTYLRVDNNGGTVVAFTSDSAALPVFPFMNTVLSPTSPRDAIWLGMTGGWQTTSTTCDDWTDAAGSTQVGNGDDTGASFFVPSAAACSGRGTVLCVEP